MRFTTALVACFAAYVSAIDLDTKAEATIDLETKVEATADIDAKAEAKSDFTPNLMEELGAPLVNGTGSTTSSAAQNDDKSDSAQTESATADSSGSTDTSASTGTKETSASDQPAITVDTEIATPTVNEQEKGPAVERGNYRPHPKNASAPYDGYFANPYHQKQDYLRPGPDKLPGPDFNKQVYDYNEMK